MLSNLKALVVVLVAAWAAFALLRPMCLQFMAESTYARRRNVWFALTIVAFASPSFAIYALFAMVLLIWAARRDSNPLALYVLVTFVVPNVRFYLPGVVVSQLFDITQYRILSLAVLVPTMWRICTQPSQWSPRRLRITDLVLLGFLLLQLIVLIPYESSTNTLRRGFLLGIDVFVVFYCFSRVSSRDQLNDLMVCFVVSCTVMAPIAIFEYYKGWLLYTGLASLWGDPNSFAWLFRGDGLRAQAAAGHSINLGYVEAIALGLLMYLRPKTSPGLIGWAPVGLCAIAVFVSGSRGAWVTAAVAIAVFAFLRPNAGRRLAATAGLAVLIVTAMYFSPLKESVLDRLPIIGTTDQDTVLYRQQLAEISWQLIRQNPLFGDPFVYAHMESLRQGQGIIDIVNGYLYTALFNGGVGLVLQVGVFLSSLWQAFKAWADVRKSDVDGASRGAALLACFVATLVFIATAGFGPTTYILCGMLVSYSLAHSYSRRQQATPEPRSFASPSAMPG